MKAIDYWNDYMDHVYACTDKNEFGTCTIIKDCEEAKKLNMDFLRAEKRELITR